MQVGAGQNQSSLKAVFIKPTRKRKFYEKTCGFLRSETVRETGSCLRCVLSCVASGFVYHGRKRMAHRGDRAAVFLRVAADPLVLRVLLVLIGSEFIAGVRGALRIHDDGPALQPLHGVFQVFLPFGGFLHFQAQTAVIRDALRLGAIANDRRVPVFTFKDPLCPLPIAHPLPPELVKQVNRLICPVIVQADKGIGFREPAPDRPLINPVKTPDFLIRNLTHLDIVEDIAAAADRNPEILVPVPPLVAFLQTFGLLQERLALPFRIVKIQIGTVKPKPVIPLDQAVPVGNAAG